MTQYEYTDYQKEAIFNTVAEMLTDRGYEQIEKQDSFSIWKNKNSNEERLKVVLLNELVNNKLINEYEKQQFQRIILIQPESDAISQDTDRLIQRIYNKTQKIIEIFNSRRLMFNVSKHYLVPKHVLLTDSQKQKLLEDLHIDEDKLKVIESTDPMAKYLGMIDGQVCMIVRPSETSMYSIDYRICRK